MSMFKRLVHRGTAVLQEWDSQDGLNPCSKLMIDELTAMSLTVVVGEEMRNWSPEERREKVDLLRNALTSAFQIGRHTAPEPATV